MQLKLLCECHFPGITREFFRGVLPYFTPTDDMSLSVSPTVFIEYTTDDVSYQKLHLELSLFSNLAKVYLRSKITSSSLLKSRAKFIFMLDLVIFVFFEYTTARTTHTLKRPSRI